MTDIANDLVHRAAMVELQRLSRQISWTQKDLDETLAHIREAQKRMLRQVIGPLVERIKTLESQVAELQQADDGKVTQLRRMR